jgi:phosphoribosyl 1,2-cyclic phosphodiesterase
MIQSMAGLAFASLLSSSAGNCSVVGGPEGAVLIDAGFPSQKKLREALAFVVAEFGPVRGVVISHGHHDHINHGSLKVLAGADIPVFLNAATVARLSMDAVRGSLLAGYELNFYSTRPFRLGGLAITPFPVTHAPGVPNHGFVIEGSNGRIGFATDLKSTKGLDEKFSGCDFVFIESNHDPELLRQNPNPSSAYHLPNGSCADLVATLVKKGTGPRTIMLGHLSVERNRPELALMAMRSRLKGLVDAPSVLVAPPFERSTIVKASPGTGRFQAGTVSDSRISGRASLP